MGKVNQLFQDEKEQQIAEWLATHPGATEEEAHYAIYADDDYAALFDPAVQS